MVARALTLLILISWSKATRRPEFRKPTKFCFTCYVKLLRLGWRNGSRLAACHAEVPRRRVRRTTPGVSGTRRDCVAHPPSPRLRRGKQSDGYKLLGIF